MTDAALTAILAESCKGILVAVKRDGHPHVSNVLYVWDAEQRVARISSTVDRVKVRTLRRRPHAALHVAGPHFWAYAVAEGEAELTAPAAAPDDDVVDELHTLYAALFPDADRDTFAARMIRERRLVIRFHVGRVYGLVRAEPRRADLRRPSG